MHKFRITIIWVNVSLALVEGVFVFWHYIQTPSESQSVVLWGFSAVRLIILLGIGLVILILVYSLINAIINIQWMQIINTALKYLVGQSLIFWVLFLSLVSMYLTIFLSDHQLGYLASYRETSRPLLVWYGLVSLQLFVSYIFLRGYKTDVLPEYRGVLIPTIVTLLLLGMLTGFIALTKIGLTRDIVYWQDAGVPILLLQVFFAVFFGTVFHFLQSRWKFFTKRKLDFFVVLILWAFASLFWLSQPLRPAYNLLAQAPPNFQNYPFADALRYDLTAQEFMVGQPIPADFFVKPFYSFLLVLFHLVAGQDFDQIVVVQVVLLACIPPLIYLLTKELGTPLAGMTAALLIIFRENNAILLSNVIEVSHSRLLLSDVPTMGLMVFLTLLMVRWLKQPVMRKAVPIAIGGVLGLLVLVRGNPILLIPFIFLAVLLVVRKVNFFLADFFLPFGLGLFLILLPWFFHNYQVTGKLVFQDISSSSLVQDQLVQLYTETAVDGDVNGQSGIIRYIFNDPLTTIKYTASHYFHNIVHSYIFLPQSFFIETTSSYAKRMPFWSGWRGDLFPDLMILLPFHLSILAFGLGAGWKKSGYVILAPLLLGIGYNLSVAITRRSGWRFNLPADWITIVFYAIGLGQLIIIVYSLVTKNVDFGKREQVLNQEGLSHPSQHRQFWIYIVLLGFISLGITQGHRLFANRFTEVSEQDLIIKYQSFIPALFQEFLDEDKAVILEGHGVYPIYFQRGDGILNYSYLNYSVKPYNRLIFYVVNDRSTGVILKTDSVPLSFPEGENIVVIGCEASDGYIDALAVLVGEERPFLLMREPFAGLHCPTSEPYLIE